MFDTLKLLKILGFEDPEVFGILQTFSILSQTQYTTAIIQQIESNNDFFRTCSIWTSTIFTRVR